MSGHQVNEPAYPPIRDYALVGDCHGAALVSRNGNVDWCCLGRFDADPVFCRILDAEKGGFFSIQPRDRFDVHRRYVPGTNVLQTTFVTPSGRLVVNDFMPIGRKPGSGVHDYVNLNAPHWLVRKVECTQGIVPVRIRYRPTVGFARRKAVLTSAAGRVLTEEGPALYAGLAFDVQGEIASAEMSLREGECKTLVVTAEPEKEPPAPDALERLLQISRAFWKEWSGYCRYRGPYQDQVLRSALVLKLLTYAPTGALVAAPTTSLPEAVGGERNWDYRYCWLRDASFTLYSLAALGYSGEARRFSQFLRSACSQSLPQLRIMYGIGGETELTEETLDHLDGYQNSRPVRTGNGAFRQQQLDVYGEILDWAWLHHTLNGRIDSHGESFLRSLGEFVAKHWQEPGEGVWEMRGPPRHHVYGKIMCWVAADRLVRLFGRDPKLEALREEIHRSILEHGRAPDSGALRQAYDAPGADAVLLLTPLTGLPIGRDVLRATVDEVEATLRQGDYIRRYTTEDGLAGNEGAFLICSFWLVDAKLLCGQAREARELFERLLECANDVGLYSEEIDPESHQFLGNFPQAFTHLALIQCADHLRIYEERGLEALQGTHADRARHSVEATSGLRALWATFKKTRRVGRLRSSRASVLSTDAMTSC